MLLLLPSDPLQRRRVDEFFAADAAAARQLGVEVGLVDHDALSAGDAARAVVRVSESDDGIYRGWMMRSEHYRELHRQLEDRGVRLRTTPEAYQRAHELPGWHHIFAEHTAPSVWLHEPGLDSIDTRAQELPAGPAIIKDWVKSMKHYWDEATYVPDVQDGDALRTVARRFLELRGGDLVGGLVVRAFEVYQPGEVRSWWVAGRCAAVTAHPDTPLSAVPDDLSTDAFLGSVQRLASPFVTVDLARRGDGRWRVVEVGDGQVSDRPPDLPPGDILRWLQ